MEVSVKMTSVLMFSMISFTGVIAGFHVWKSQSSEAMSMHSSLYPQKIQTVNQVVLGKEFPSIEAKDIYLRQHETFQAMDHVKASDAKGDITPRVQAYGEVDVDTKGEYQVRYVVRNDFGLKTTKYMKVIVD